MTKNMVFGLLITNLAIKNQKLTISMAKLKAWLHFFMIMDRLEKKGTGK